MSTPEDNSKKIIKSNFNGLRFIPKLIRRFSVVMLLIILRFFRSVTVADAGGTPVTEAVAVPALNVWGKAIMTTAFGLVTWIRLTKERRKKK